MLNFATLASKAYGLIHESYVEAQAADISSTDHSFPKPTRALYVGGAGALVVEMVSGKVVTFTAVPVGTTLKISVNKIIKTDTVASAIVGLF